MKLSDYLTLPRIFLDLEPGNKREVLLQIVQNLVKNGQFDPKKEDLFLQKLLEREDIKSTGIGSGIALPHAIVEDSGESFVCLARCLSGTNFDAADQKPVHIVVTLVGSLKDRPIHLNLLGCIANFMIDPAIPQSILEASSAKEIIQLFKYNECELD